MVNQTIIRVRLIITILDPLNLVVSVSLLIKKTEISNSVKKPF